MVTRRLSVSRIRVRALVRALGLALLLYGPVALAPPAEAAESTAADAPASATATDAGSTAAAATSTALRFDLHGYFRARYTRISNVPIARLDDTGSLASATHTGRDDASSAHFMTSRLRLEPSLSWGGDPTRGELPTVSVQAQVDALDNVVWGDNARAASVPLFAENPSATGVGGDERPALFVRRLWLDLKLPVGLLKVGRQASQGGPGLLFNDGNGFRNDFGDADGGSTFDRVAFATRPLTILRALTRGDRRETPLILVVGHDWLVEDALGFGSSAKPTSTRTAAGPFGFLTTPSCGGAADPDGTAPTAKCDDDVSQWLTALIWKDTGLNFRQASDELLVGLVYVSRGQDFNKSRMHIFDAFWRLQLGLAREGPSLRSEGEVAIIRGSTTGLKLLPGGPFDEATGLAKNALDGDILNAAGRIGVVAPAWDALLEVGHSSGDEQLIGGDRAFKMFPMHADYKMGLLMFPVAVFARSSNTAAALASDALHSGGGVFNSTYLNLKGRLRRERPGHQLELVVQGLVGWADTLNGGKVLGFTADYFAPRDAADPWAGNVCAAFDPACAIGWELDAAVKLRWLPMAPRPQAPGAPSAERFALRWSTEVGVMRAGAALAPRLAVGADTLWTVQSRLAVVF